MSTKTFDDFSKKYVPHIKPKLQKKYFENINQLADLLDTTYDFTIKKIKQNPSTIIEVVENSSLPKGCVRNILTLIKKIQVADEFTHFSKHYASNVKPNSQYKYFTNLLKLMDVLKKNYSDTLNFISDKPSKVITAVESSSLSKCQKKDIYNVLKKINNIPVYQICHSNTKNAYDGDIASKEIENIDWNAHIKRLKKKMDWDNLTAYKYQPYLLANLFKYHPRRSNDYTIALVTDTLPEKPPKNSKDDDVYNFYIPSKHQFIFNKFKNKGYATEGNTSLVADKKIHKILDKWMELNNTGYFLVTAHNQPYETSNFGNYFKNQGFLTANTVRKLNTTKKIQDGASPAQIAFDHNHSVATQQLYYNKRIKGQNYADLDKRVSNLEKKIDKMLKILSQQSYIEEYDSSSSKSENNTEKNTDISDSDDSSTSKNTKRKNDTAVSDESSNQSKQRSGKKTSYNVSKKEVDQIFAENFKKYKRKSR